MTDKNVADKLLEDYPKPDGRRTMLAENFRKAMPFLAFDEVEKHIGAGKDRVAYSGSQTTAAYYYSTSRRRGFSIFRPVSKHVVFVSQHRTVLGVVQFCHFSGACLKI